MNLSDLIIVYLAFGAPFSVHYYLSSGAVEPGRRLARSILTLLFWIPLAIRLVRRYFLHAYSKGDFVSRNFLDAGNERIAVLSEAVVAELRPSIGDLSVHDLRDIVSRYVGLALLTQPTEIAENPSYDLFRAAARVEPELATICLARKQERHIRQHLDRARVSLLSLYELAAKYGVTPACAIELARELRDTVALRSLLDDRSQIDGTGRKVPLHGIDPAPPQLTTAVSFTAD